MQQTEKLNKETGNDMTKEQYLVLSAMTCSPYTAEACFDTYEEARNYICDKRPSKFYSYRVMICKSIVEFQLDKE